MAEDDRQARIEASRAQLRQRFLDRQRASPALSDENPAGEGPPNRHGMPRLRGGSRGDLRLLANVQVPRALDDDQRKLVESFRQLEAERNYAHPERSRSGLRDRLRRAFG